MPVTITKVKGGFRVKTPRMIHAKRTSLANAKKQERILNMAELGKKKKRKEAKKRK